MTQLKLAERPRPGAVRQQSFHPVLPGHGVPVREYGPARSTARGHRSDPADRSHACRGQALFTHTKCLNNASVGLPDRYDARGDEADLDRSIEYSRQALRTKTAAHHERPGWLSNLGNTLRHRFERSVVLADLDDAIEVLERAAATALKQWADRAGCLMNLGSALRTRAWVSRSTDFLRRAPRCSRSRSPRAACRVPSWARARP